MFQLGRARRARRETIERLYGAIVAQARVAAFYADYGVPDTIEGRFDLMVLHVHLLFRRLSTEGKSLRELGQAVFDRFCDDLDGSLRELGTGDLAVPRQMRDFGQAYYGRAASYDAGLADADEGALVSALRRNIYGASPSADNDAIRLARYVRRAVSRLADLQPEALERGEIRFPAPDEREL